MGAETERQRHTESYLPLTHAKILNGATVLPTQMVPLKKGFIIILFNYVYVFVCGGICAHEYHQCP